MNEDHLIAAILTVGLVARNTNDELQPKDVVAIYGLTLRTLIESIRPPREESSD